MTFFISRVSLLLFLNFGYEFNLMFLVDTVCYQSHQIIFSNNQLFIDKIILTYHTYFTTLANALLASDTIFAREKVIVHTPVTVRQRTETFFASTDTPRFTPCIIAALPRLTLSLDITLAIVSDFLFIFEMFANIMKESVVKKLTADFYYCSITFYGSNPLLFNISRTVTSSGIISSIK